MINDFSVPSAWIILAKHMSGESQPGYKLIGVLDKQISGPSMLLMVRALYSSYLQDPNVENLENIAELTTISYKYLNDGSPWEDWVVCWGKSDISIEAIRVHDMSLEAGARDVSYLKWRMEHLIVNASNMRETDFWESCGLPINGINPLTIYDEA